MAISVAKKRLLSLDLIRGYLLVVIILDHLGRWPSPFEFLTGRGGLWISAAEGFFFISGLLVSLTAIRKIQQLGFKTIWLKLWKRSLLLYVITITATLFFTWAAFQLGWPPKPGLAPQADWASIIQQTLQLKYSYGWHDFLPRYAIYMFFAPVAGYLLHRGMWWAVLWTSGLIWVWQGPTNFDAAWQIIFYTGMVVGYHFYQIKDWFSYRLTSDMQRLTKQSLVAISLISLTGSYALNILPRALVDYHQLVDPIWYRFSDPAHKSMVADILATWSKSLSHLFSHGQMGIGRIALFLICFTALFMVTQRFDRHINRWLGWLLAPLGRNSLLTYMVHAVILFFYPVLLPWTGGWISNTLDAMVAILTTWLGVGVIAYRRSIITGAAQALSRITGNFRHQSTKQPPQAQASTIWPLLGLMSLLIIITALIRPRQ